LKNVEKLQDAFSKALNIEKGNVVDSLSYGNKKWDSIAHMVLISTIENEFGIMIDTDDVINMSSFKKAKEIIAKYGVNLNT
jgi:acyl carrier protein